MKAYRKLFATLILLLFSFSSVTHADIMPDPITAGESPKPFSDERTEVRMVSEDVLVKVYFDEIVTVAKFQMFNEGDTESMEVGFPYVYEGNFIEFTVIVDGEEIQVHDGKQENVGRRKSTVLWKLWDMRFAKNMQCDVRVEYKTRVYEHEQTLVWTDCYVSMPQEEIDQF